MPEDSRTRAVFPEDLEWIVPLVRQQQGTLRFTLRANDVSPHLVSAMVFEPSPAAAVIELGGQPLALVVASNHLQRHGIARLDMLVDPAAMDEVGPTIIAFCQDEGSRLGLHKWWAWSLEDELDVPAVLGDIARPAGVLAQHERRGPDAYVAQCAYDVWLPSVHIKGDGDHRLSRVHQSSVPPEAAGQVVAP